METIQKKTSAAQTRANKKYSDKNMKMISVNLNKDVFELLEAGVLKSGINRNKYVTTAILEKLKRDGFLSEWDVVLNTMCNGVDNFIL